MGRFLRLGRISYLSRLLGLAVGIRPEAFVAPGTTTRAGPRRIETGSNAGVRFVRSPTWRPRRSLGPSCRVSDSGNGTSTGQRSLRYYLRLLHESGER